MARFRLELGPIPLHHQVYLDLKAALDAGEWQPGDRLPTERDLAARYGCSLITGPARARASSSASSGSSGPAVAARSCSTRASTATSPVTSRSPRRCRLRGLDPETRLIAARPESAGEAVAAALGLELGSPTLYLERLRARRRRAAAARAGPPAGRAVPGPARVGPRARLAVRPADRALRRPRREGPRGSSSRSCCAPGRRGCWDGSRARRPCSSRASPSTADGIPVEFGRTFVRGDRTRYYVERVVVRPHWEAAAHAGGGPAPMRSPTRLVTRLDTTRRNRMERRIGRIGVLLATLALVATACGGSHDLAGGIGRGRRERARSTRPRRSPRRSRPARPATSRSAGSAASAPATHPSRSTVEQEVAEDVQRRATRAST